MTAAARQIDFVSDPHKAVIALKPLRRQLLELLREPNSASGLARQLGLPRQKLSYHLRELEEAGFIKQVEQRRKGNCIERIVQATAAAYIISPDLIGSLGDTPARARDRFSSTHLIATAARLIRDLIVLRRRADAVNKKLPTLCLQCDVRFATATQRDSFAEDLSQFIASRAAAHHDASAAEGRVYRFVLAGYPAITKSEEQAEQEAKQYHRDTTRNRSTPDDTQ